MSNDTSISKPDNTGENGTQPDPANGSHTVKTAPVSRGSSASSVVRVTNGILADRSHGDPSVDKSDSEAETVVLSGKEEDQEHKKSKAAELVDVDEAKTVVEGKSEDSRNTKDEQSEGSKEPSSRKPSLKRKRSTQDPPSDLPEGGISSNLSSTISSPVQEAHSSKASNAASDRSRSSPPFDDVAQQQQQQHGRPNKQRPNVKTRHHSHQEGKGDRDTERVSARKRRDTRSATHYDDSTHRSETPPQHNIRGQSIQPILPHAGVTKRRKAPAPLHVEPQRKASEDTHLESDDSSSVHSHHHLQRFASTDNNAMSPAKMVSHKKNRDRNGRTLLARACAQDAVEVERWLKDRPQDLNVPDNAGNTPLQIAALEGDTEIVRLLLNAGCDITCKNIDKDTPLIDAVENGHVEVVKILLKAGLDPRIGNARGREPLDLVPEDDEDGEGIRSALLASKKEKELLRRPSEDHSRQHNTGSRDVEMTGTSPVHSTRSPPPPGPGARRRTARSQPTDDALLWVNATPARLRDAAGKGDLNIVDHILKMRPEADTESVLAAARGGHEVVLGLLLAIAKPDPDPEPLRSGEYKLGYNTPMLAAIGRGNASIIKLLLEQPGFDPTRRLFKTLTYYEIARERKGSEWEDEVEMLKEAYDNYKHSGGRKSNSNSPRKVRTKRADSTKTSEPSSSPHEARKARRPMNLEEEESPDLARRETHKDDSLLPDANSHSHAHAKFTKKVSSTDTSDRERDSLGPPKSKSKGGRSSADAEHLTVKPAHSLKPKRRLMSGNERRASLAAEASLELKRQSGDSVYRDDNIQRRSSDASESTANFTSEEQSHVKGEPGKKRHRMSVSPQASRSNPAVNIDPVKKKKRQKVDSPGNAIDPDHDHFFRPGPAMVANMIASSSTVASPTLSQGTAPVAFMGSNVASPVTKSPTDLRPDSAMISPVTSIDQALQRRPGSEDTPAQRQVDEDKLRHENLERERDRQAAREEEERLAKLEAEKQKQLQAEHEAQARARAEREAAESKACIAREEEEARVEAQRQAEKQLQQEREEEEARVAKKKRDEEIQKRRKEDQERRRREQEERESLRRIREQENEERLRRASLPNGLRRAAELRPEEAKTAKEITKWLPLRTVTSQELDPERYYDPTVAEERWIANIQGAPILAITDLGLSQCIFPVPPTSYANTLTPDTDTAWTRIPASIDHQGSLWRQLRNPMSQATPLALLSPEEVFSLDGETRPKFFALKPVFWLRLSDFMDIVPRHQHLTGLQLKTRAIVLHEFPFGRGGTVDRPAGAEGAVKQEAMSPVMNGNMTNGFR